jgi:hypothetical protein
VPGLAVGALPALLVYAVTGTSAFSLWGSSPLDHLAAEAAQRGPPPDAVAKLVDLLRDGYTWTLQYEQRALGDATLLLAAACALGLLVAAARAWRRGTERAPELVLRGGFFVIYPAVFSAAYAVSSGSFKIMEDTLNAIDVRYAMPVVPFLLLPIGLAAARLHESGRRIAGVVLLAPALALGLWGSLSTWSLDAILREPARRGFLWESFDGHLVWGALPEAQRTALDAATRDIADRGERDQAAIRFVLNNTSPELWFAELRACDDTPAWTWPLRYRAPVGSPPKAGLKAYASWLAPLSKSLRPFAFAAASSELAGAEAFSDTAMRALMNSASGEHERRATLRGFGDGLILMRRNGRVTLLRFYDEKPVLERIRNLPDWMDRDEVLFGLGFRVGRIIHEFYAYGDPIMLRTLAALPPDLRIPFVRGLGAGYRMRFLAPPPAALGSPAVMRITTRLSPDLEAHFRAGLGGAETAR